jgi:hypothetical protein
MNKDDLIRRWMEVEDARCIEESELDEQGRKLVVEQDRFVETHGSDPKAWSPEVCKAFDHMSNAWDAWHNRMNEMFGALLREAEAGLSRNSIDGVDLLWSRYYSLAAGLNRLSFGGEPPEVTRFVAEFKRQRGRMRSNRAQVKKYLSNPNWRAAVYAADYVKEFRRGEKRKGPHKVQTPDGRKRNVHDIAVELAVKKINANPDEFGGRANPKLVKELLRRGRGAPKLFKW